MSLADGLLLRWCLLSKPGKPRDMALGLCISQCSPVGDGTQARASLSSCCRPVQRSSSTLRAEHGSGEKPCGDSATGPDPQVVTRCGCPGKPNLSFCQQRAQSCRGGERGLHFQLDGSQLCSHGMSLSVRTWLFSKLILLLPSLPYRDSFTLAPVLFCSLFSPVPGASWSTADGHKPPRLTKMKRSQGNTISKAVTLKATTAASI